MFELDDITPEQVADLRGMKQDDALIKLSEALDVCRITGATALLVKIDPATPTSGETLFRPVGEALREAKKQRYVDYCCPVAQKDCGGFLVIFPDGPTPKKH